MAEKYWWISWHQKTDDHRPLHFPPREDVLGWWCTGYRCADDVVTLVAHVRAESEDAAKDVIRADWPEADEWRFCTPHAPTKPGDRFPLSDWMELRYGQAEAAAAG